MEKIVSQRKFLIIILAGIALLSIFVFSKIASSPEFHEHTIKALDDKKVAVMELATATAVTSTAIAAIPSDATSPLANQIVELSEYLLIVIGVIFLEKILLTATGYVTFSYLIPIACLLYGIYLFVDKEILRSIAIKIAIFGVAIFMVVPVSVKVSELVEKTQEISINQTIEDAKNFTDTAKEEKKENSENVNGWENFVSGIKDAVSSVGDTVSNLIKKGEQLLSRFIDAIAVLLITSCVIPILVLLFFGWIIKILFGINIPAKNIMKKKVKKEEIK
ncbi:MAG: hypothetical protein J6C46_08155 [Clostridia bacterium]|nr:hypothetical protein [Clostridia bacterium]